MAALGRMFVPSMLSINSSSFDSIGGGIGLLVLLTPAWPASVHVVASNGCNRVHRDTAQAKQFLHLWCLLWFVLRRRLHLVDQPVSPTAPTTLSSENDFAVIAHCACGEVSERHPRKPCQVRFEFPRYFWLHRRSAAPQARGAPCASVRRARRIHPATGRVGRRSSRIRAIRRSFAR